MLHTLQHMLQLIVKFVIRTFIWQIKIIESMEQHSQVTQKLPSLWVLLTQHYYDTDKRTITLEKLVCNQFAEKTKQHRGTWENKGLWHI